MTDLYFHQILSEHQKYSDRFSIYRCHAAAGMPARLRRHAAAARKIYFGRGLDAISLMILID